MKWRVKQLRMHKFANLTFYFAVRYSGACAACTAALLVPVFALALQVFVVRIHRTACCCKGSDLAFCFFAGRGNGLAWRLFGFLDAGMGMELVAQSQAARLCC